MTGNFPHQYEILENLSKKYILSHQSQERYTALRDVMADGE